MSRFWQKSAAAATRCARAKKPRSFLCVIAIHKKMASFWPNIRPPQNSLKIFLCCSHIYFWAWKGVDIPHGKCAHVCKNHIESFSTYLREQPSVRRRRCRVCVGIHTVSVSTNWFGITFNLFHSRINACFTYKIGSWRIEGVKANESVVL